MFSSEQIDAMVTKLKAQLKADEKNKGLQPFSEEGRQERIDLTPSQILTILALLAGTLDVTSVVFDRDQRVQIVLSGTLQKQEENELEKLIGHLGAMPFDQVMKAMLSKFR
ncbi:hypothetical protein [Clostridium formicaceticum]|jgi:hypothetical protein|uniref:Uncharacterized protein n=1 Tax=Clostridium formicaceticum TaxID=1497 RepID=A0AAC9RRE7_9CLOT|nr:hypothetical protein [Clostridium formicaceticum]ARE89628.1 hypothetical protein CLFO_41090 [Clostridium formicaceticum]